MSQSSGTNSATSAISLAAITAGAVAAAVVIMSIGSIVTIISIGASINPGSQQTASNFIDSNDGIQNVAVLPVAMQATNTGNFYKVNKKNNKNKSFYIDAILREESHTISPDSEQNNIEPKQQQPKLSIKGNHVFASLNAEETHAELAAA
ncbi:hypothetical protein ACFQ2T_02710 [Methylophilus flavus]|jgi:hypothetical protein|uniref:Uncharacterized protein n=1 Tax=Methylophilus flavus TaxID=640084 RepID=A0ABW3P9G5_9PROT